MDKKKMLIAGSALIIIIALIICIISISKKNPSTKDNINQLNSELSAEELLQKQQEEKQQQEEELKRQDEYTEAYEKSEVTIGDISNNNTTTVTITNDEADIHEELNIHDVNVDEETGSIAGITEDGDPFFYDNEVYPEESQEPTGEYTDPDLSMLPQWMQDSYGDISQYVINGEGDSTDETEEETNFE